MSGEAVISPTAGSADARGRVAASARVGMFAPFDLLAQGPETARAFLARVGEAGIDHVGCAGCTEFNLIPQSPDPDQSIAATAAVKGLLA